MGARDASKNGISATAILDTKRDIHTLDDTTPPTIVTFSPENTVVGVARSGFVIQLTFSEDVEIGTGVNDLTITDGSNSVTVSTNTADPDGTFSLHNNVLTMTPDNLVQLSPSTAFRVIIGSGLVVDSRGNLFAGIPDHTYTWTTAA